MSKLLPYNETQIYTLGTNLVSQKVIDSYDIKKDIDSFEGPFFTAYLTRLYVFSDMGESIRCQCFFSYL